MNCSLPVGNVGDDFVANLFGVTVPSRRGIYELIIKKVRSA
jgi:hypothetical protein